MLLQASMLCYCFDMHEMSLALMLGEVDACAAACGFLLTAVG